MINLLPLTLILWPFSIGVFNSQIIGLAVFLLILPSMVDIKYIKIIEVSLPATLWYLLFCATLFFSLIFSGENSEILKLVYYVLIIPFLFFLAFIYERFLHKNDGFTDVVKILYTAVPFVAFCVLEIVFPSFHDFIAPYTTTDAARHVIENGFSGNSFRNLGWNGFLFADYSVALAFTALGVLIFEKKPNLFSLTFEYLCIFLALIAGRSGLPIIIVYIFVSLVYKFNIIRFCSLFLIFFISGLYFIDKIGDDFFIWMLEPIYKYMEEGKFSSGSVNETNEQFKDFFANINYSQFYNFLGDGVYFSSNFSYDDLNRFAGDSGLIRIYHAVGVLGLICFLLMWVSIFLKVSYSLIKNNKHLRACKLFLIIFMMYGFLFFFKSEWLYQKFFIFISFYFYHRIYRKFNVLKLSKTNI